MKLLTKDDKVALVACSNGLSEKMREKIEFLINTLESLGLKCVVINHYVYTS